MSKRLDSVMRQLDIHPILVDIGASGAPPGIWREIERHSVYVGFDPDQRDIEDIQQGRFFRSVIINQAVTPERAPRSRVST